MAAPGARFSSLQASCGLVWRPPLPARPQLPHAKSSDRAPRSSARIPAVGAASRASPAPPAAAARPGPSFEERCAQLDRFRREHGHSRVPVQEPSGLGAWAARQRHAWRAGRLSPERQQALTSLGLGANAYEDAWALRFAQLAAFHSQHGHCRVPRPPPLPADATAAPAAGERRRTQRRRAAEHAGSAAGWQGYSPPGLYRWLQEQCMQWRRGTLPDERRRRLEGLGVEFTAHQAGWDRRYAQLLSFREEFGHANVPAHWAPNPALAGWVASQRRRWRCEQGAPLTRSQLSRLQACGFSFQVQHSAWERRYAELRELASQRGGRVGTSPLPRESGLDTWAAAQLHKWRRGALAPERVEQLRALGLAPRPAQVHWCQQERLRALDRLLAALGPAATHALLVLHPQPSVAASMAAVAAAAAAAAPAGAASTAYEEDTPGDSAGPADPEAAAREAAEVVLWYRAARARRRVSRRVAAALAARGLDLRRQPG